MSENGVVQNRTSELIKESTGTNMLIVILLVVTCEGDTRTMDQNKKEWITLNMKNHDTQEKLGKVGSLVSFQ